MQLKIFHVSEVKNIHHLQRAKFLPFYFLYDRRNIFRSFFVCYEFCNRLSLIKSGLISLWSSFSLIFIHIFDIKAFFKYLPIHNFCNTSIYCESLFHVSSFFFRDALPLWPGKVLQGVLIYHKILVHEIV